MKLPIHLRPYLPIIQAISILHNATTRFLDDPATAELDLSEQQDALITLNDARVHLCKLVLLKHRDDAWLQAKASNVVMQLGR